MIIFDDVSKSYRTGLGLKRILRDFDGELPTDLNIGILGGNGSGKSTLMRLLAGSESPDRGRIYRDGRVSFPVGQAMGFNTHMTGRGNAAFLARVYGADVGRVIDFVGDFAELGAYLDEPLRTYSNGMRARLSFSLCMAIEFDVYLVDEVTAAGDVAFKRKCNQVFAERRRKSKMVMASSNTKMIKLYCDRGAILDGGRIHLFDSIDEAVSVYETKVYTTEISVLDRKPIWEGARR